MVPAGCPVLQFRLVGEAVECVTEAGATAEEVRPIGLSWPREIVSLSHVALPFPITDALYGLQPDPAEGFGVQFGAIAPRGTP